MRTRNWQIGAAVVAGLAALQSPFMLPFYLARRPLVAGEVRTGGTWWNLLRAFAATYAVGTALLVLRYSRPALFGLV